MNLQKDFIRGDPSPVSMWWGKEGRRSLRHPGYRLSSYLFGMSSFLSPFWKCHGTAMAGPA